ncbi:dTDP-4-dehydrorhamnose 3,5-epimerase [Saccharomonospora sp. CUA-673]|uniref:dTDP-4-dehydrorhamnose 3,5-epimerase family protein n=1 Tax=Saccharomonospora sp. CUA-673 TaxID=1904969 RepID=UPI0009618AB4|nr:dTDP-4-dehydrorhamnose 3,5-epimerase family protein [Saccharomonospora sp. CUA-673]OLT49025.1 dTDP-4-dehydrorhamnose 3,5-epimerase [Saccharomonospora sp. CUA-673]
MDVETTAIPDVFVFHPKKILDNRGDFFEALRFPHLEELTERPFRAAQVNYSTSRRNTLRGIHSVTVPPGQAKLVSCVRGAARDVAVDLRLGSPTFGVHHSTILDPDRACTVYVPEGVGHGFLTLTDDTVICYVLSSVHVPGTQIDINPWDPSLNLPWKAVEPVYISDKDRAAPSVAEAERDGLLMTWPGPTLSKGTSS